MSASRILDSHPESLILGETGGNDKKNMFKKTFYLLTLSILIPKISYAICPVCTIAVGAGLGLSRWLGIDDTVSSLWIGGLLVSLIMWTNSWLEKKQIHFKYRNIVIVTAYYLITILPLYFTNIVGHALNQLWGLDKIILGITLGSLAFYFGAKFHFHTKKKNGDRVHFPFQKVAFSILPLIILSVIFYYLTK